MNRIALVLALTCLVSGAAVAQDEAVTRGEQAFRVCGGCHSVGEGAVSRMGPQLNGVMGAPAASRPDFNYSQAMQAKAAEGLVWDHENMTAFLRKPRDFVPGTKMAFGGIPDDERIDDIIAYLATFSPDYVPAEDGSAAAASAPKS